MDKTTLYGKSSSGKTQVWSTWIEVLPDATANIWTEYGELGGNLVKRAKLVSSGKNMGRANETTPIAQATSEMNAAINKKLDKGYVADQDEVSIPLLPMLAKTYKEYPTKWVNVYIQPKMDGFRAFAKRVGNKVIFTSRTGKRFDTMKHLESALLGLMRDGEIWDGELYSHLITFQEVASAIKKVGENTSKIQFWVYDVATDHETFHDRFVRGVAIKRNPNIQQVPTMLIHSEQEIIEWHDRFVAQGYEGAIIRNGHGKYKFAKRSADLLKYKSFDDAEFEIVGITCPENGTHAGCIMYEVQVADGITATVSPQGELEERRDLYDAYLAGVYKPIGQPYTVRFFGYTDNGNLRMPIGIGIRDYE